LTGREGGSTTRRQAYCRSASGSSSVPEEARLATMLVAMLPAACGGRVVLKLA
jgi:hypothetical protein